MNKWSYVDEYHGVRGTFLVSDNSRCPYVIHCWCGKYLVCDRRGIGKVKSIIPGHSLDDVLTKVHTAKQKVYRLMKKEGLYE